MIVRVRCAGSRRHELRIDLSVEISRLRRDTDVDQLALALLAAVQGGLLLAQAHRNTAALEAGLDTALAAVRSQATARR